MQLFPFDLHIAQNKAQVKNARLFSTKICVAFSSKN